VTREVPREEKQRRQRDDRDERREEGREREESGGEGEEREDLISAVTSLCVSISCLTAILMMRSNSPLEVNTYRTRQQNIQREWGRSGERDDRSSKGKEGSGQRRSRGEKRGARYLYDLCGWRESHVSKSKSTVSLLLII
jgi:hypothetical protein